MMFILPKNVKNPPMPLNSDLHLGELDKSTEVVYKFSGRY